MGKLSNLVDLTDRVLSDQHLTKAHLALFLAICSVWIASGFQHRFHISRRVLMTKGKIQSNATYHKMMKDLQALGYLQYRPSYHPVKASEFTLVFRGG